jgi:hypothetical protein
MSETERDRQQAEFERRAQDAFRSSVDDLDAATLSRLNRSRQRALEAARGSNRHGSRWLMWAPAGALAAAVLAAALLLRTTPDTSTTVAVSAPADAQPEAFDLLAAGEDLELATEADLDFYAWVELATADDGVG